MQEKGMKGIQIRKEEVKLFADDVISYIINPKMPLKLLELLTSFSKFQDIKST